MSKANKKQRHDSKRKAKRQAMRRREAASPIKRLADAPGELECWISEADFRSLGQMQIFVYKRAGGLAGMAAFLLDRGVVGLKDAWVRMYMSALEFEDALKASRESGIAMRRSSTDEIRPWIAGGLRWAHENGMRLPRDWMKPASLIGGVGDWHAADVSAFVKEFAGHPEDLRQRLVGEPFDTYVQREDIEFVFDTDAPFMDQETGEYVDADPALEDLSVEEVEAIAADVPFEELNEMADQLAPTTHGLVTQTDSWLKTQGDVPSPELPEAWNSVLLASMLSTTAMPNAKRDDVADFGYDLLEGLSARIDPSRVAEYDRAVEQVLRHLETNESLMQQAIMQHGTLHQRQ